MGEEGASPAREPDRVRRDARGSGPRRDVRPAVPRVDFISIGTNDLTQFLFAGIRSDPRLAHRYDWLSPAILRFLKRVLDQSRAAGVPARVCGEMAGRPLEAMALIGIGAENFSITPAGVGRSKR